jgi:hypothetical protein
MAHSAYDIGEGAARSPQDGRGLQEKGRHLHDRPAGRRTGAIPSDDRRPIADRRAARPVMTQRIQQRSAAMALARVSQGVGHVR